MRLVEGVISPTNTSIFAPLDVLRGSRIGGSLKGGMCKGALRARRRDHVGSTPGAAGIHQAVPGFMFRDEVDVRDGRMTGPGRSTLDGMWDGRMKGLLVGMMALMGMSEVGMRTGPP